MEQNLFGQILLNLNLITEAQLAEVLESQQDGDERPLGELLLDRKLVDEKTIHTILSIQTRRMKVETGSCRRKSKSTEKLDLSEAGVIEFLELARQSGASHVFLGVGEAPAFRVHGNLADLGLEPLSCERAQGLLFQLLDEKQLEAYRQQKSLCISHQHPDVGRFRLNLFQHTHGDCGVFRLVNEKIQSFEELDLPAAVCDLAAKSNGLVLITGPCRSGKSTTLAALIDFVNQNYQRHIITIENPLEAIHQSAKSLVSHREIGKHTQSYSMALRGALREDPDVLVIGEMNDQETISTAITAAETGHLVFGTLHTKNSYRTIVRILDQFPPEKRSHVRSILAGVLRGIVSQDLVPNLDGKGMSLAYEVMLVNAAVANLIREDRIWQIPMTMQMSGGDGMNLMDDSLLRLVREEKISLEEAVLRATEREKFLRLDSLKGGGTASRRSSKQGVKR